MIEFGVEEDVAWSLEAEVFVCEGVGRMRAKEEGNGGGPAMLPLLKGTI